MPEDHTEKTNTGRWMYLEQGATTGVERWRTALTPGKSIPHLAYWEIIPMSVLKMK